jgi:T-complex protein 1 subunit delta
MLPLQHRTGAVLTCISAADSLHPARAFSRPFLHARSSLSSKVISQHTALMSPMAVDAVLRVIDPQHQNL